MTPSQTLGRSDSSHIQHSENVIFISILTGAVHSNPKFSTTDKHLQQLAILNIVWLKYINNNLAINVFYPLSRLQCKIVSVSETLFLVCFNKVGCWIKWRNLSNVNCCREIRACTYNPWPHSTSFFFFFLFFHLKVASRKAQI